MPPETHSEKTPNLVIFIVTAYKNEFSECSARVLVNIQNSNTQNSTWEKIFILFKWFGNATENLR